MQCQDCGRTTGIKNVKVTSDSFGDSELNSLILVHKKQGYHSYTEKL